MTANCVMINDLANDGNSMKELAENLDLMDIVPRALEITPPDEDGDNIDCESGDEECNNPDTLNHNQFQAEAKFCFSDDERQTEWSEDDDLLFQRLLKGLKLKNIRNASCRR
ncbi:hypothetical protein FQR65_LT09157 [Abscondita terminalis]|nr:hypothetical protein FQR65_LT09157 [Abscondita terminalis]